MHYRRGVLRCTDGVLAWAYRTSPTDRRLGAEAEAMIPYLVRIGRSDAIDREQAGQIARLCVCGGGKGELGHFVANRRGICCTTGCCWSVRLPYRS